MNILITTSIIVIWRNIKNYTRTRTRTHTHVYNNNNIIYNIITKVIIYLLYLYYYYILLTSLNESRAKRNLKHFCYTSNKYKISNDMYKQLIQDIIKAGNKAVDSVPVRYTIDTEDNRYYCYDGLYYDDNHVEFTDDYDDDITLTYEDIVGIRVGGI